MGFYLDTNLKKFLFNIISTMASKQSFQQIFSDSLWSVEVHYGMLFNLDPAGVEPQPNSMPTPAKRVHNRRASANKWQF